MIREILKTILAGILGGIALFILPFVLVRILIFFLLVKLIFRLVRGRNYYGWQRCRPAYMKNMSAEERRAYMNKYGYCKSDEYNNEQNREETTK